MASQHHDYAEVEYIDCWCGIPDHVIRVSTAKQHRPKEEPFLELEYQLRPGSFWLRLRTAILYLFFPSVCNWQGALFDEDGAKRISNLLQKYLNSHREWKLSSQGKCVSCESTSSHAPECTLNRCLP